MIMLIEKQIENNLLSALYEDSVLSSCQFITSRNTVSEGEIIKEDGDIRTIICIGCGIRECDAFSLTPISLPVTFTITTRIEMDETGENHENIVEKIMDKLSYWHKYTNSLTPILGSEKFSFGELRFNGGTGRIINKENDCFIDTINVTIRGSVKFTS